MNKTHIKDLMVPLDDYALVSQDATVLDALLALEQAQARLAPGRQKHRAVLVVDGNRRVIGKIGQLGFLKALEPKYNIMGDLDRAALTGISSEFISSMLRHYNFFQDDLGNLCLRAGALPVAEVMRPVTESIDENATLGEVLHKMVMLQTLSLLVTRQGEVVGLIRQSDLFEEVSRRIKDIHQSQDR